MKIKRRIIFTIFYVFLVVLVFYFYLEDRKRSAGFNAIKRQFEQSLKLHSTKNNELIANWEERDDAYELAMDLELYLNRRRRDKPLKVLFFDKFEDFQNRMDRFLYDWIEGAQNHPDINVTWWGIGFNGWDPKLSATENVKQKFGCGYFDLVVGHYDYMGPHMVLEDCGKTIMMQEIGDCHHRQCHALYTPKSHILSFKYAFIPLELFNSRDADLPALKEAMEEPARHLIAHNPDCANRLAFKPIPWSKKSIDAQLFGATYPNLYPLRNKIQKGIESGIIKAVQFKHSGYNQDWVWFDNIKKHILPTDIPDSYSRFNPEFGSLLVPQIEFASQMQATKICIFDTSFVKKAIRKFQEAMAAGCVIASDMPMEMEDILDGVIIRLEVDMTPTQINTILQKALSNDKELKRKAARGLKLAHDLFWCERKAERMYKLYEDYRNGHRGYYFPLGFRLGCHSYIADRPSNPWCPKNNYTVEGV